MAPLLSLATRYYLAFFIILISTAVGGKQSSTNLYSLLGCTRTASKDDLRRAYRRQCLRHHPDKGGDEERFKQINKAYEILSDPEQRRRYDNFYGETPPSGTTHHGFRPQTPFGTHSFSFSSQPGGRSSFFQSTPTPNVDLEELLAQMMMGGPSRGSFAPQTPREYQRPLACSLEELATGGEKKLKVRLHGRTKVYRIILQPGWKAGTKIRFAADQTFPAICFVLQEKPHPLYQRRGHDIVYRHGLPSNNMDHQPVTIDLTLLNGQAWTRTLPAGSSWLRRGQVLTIPNEGMPVKGGPARGNLLIEFY